MRVKKEHTEENNSRSFADTFAWYMGLYGQHVFIPSHSNPTLGEMRGRIVFLQDFDKSTRWGINYDRLDDQDDFDIGSNFGLYDKWVKVKEHIERAENGNLNTIYINYLSGVSGFPNPSFPYFVASGHSSPGTSAPRLSTGRTTPAFNSSYPDFPRVSCVTIFVRICTIAFEGTNTLTKDYINDGRTIFTGIVMADFPGAGLINAIINLNPTVSSFLKFSRLKNRLWTDHYIHIEHGSIQSSSILPGWRSAQWIEEPIPGTNFIKLRNRWKPDHYIHIEHGRIESSAIQPGWGSAHWMVERVANTDFFTLRNRWLSHYYIHIENGTLNSSPIHPSSSSAQWQLQRTTRIKAWHSWPEKCLHKKDSGENNGNPIHLWDCNTRGDENRTWLYEPDTGLIRAAVNLNKCLHKHSGWSNGNRIHLWDCAAGPLENRTWDYEPATKYIRARHNPSKCFHKKSAGWDNGNPIHLWDCAAGPPENKTFSLLPLP